MKFRLILVCLVLFSCKVLSQSQVSIATFGADGFDRYDDTNSIQAAIDFARRNSIKDVTFPIGNFLISRPIVVYDDITLTGSPGNSTLKATKLISGGIFTLNNVTNITIRKLRFEGLNLNLNPSSIERLLYIKYSREILIEDVCFSNALIGLQIEESSDFKVFNSNFNNIKSHTNFARGYGILINTNSIKGSVSCNSFRDIDRHAIYVSSGSNKILIDSNVIANCGAASIQIMSYSNQSSTEQIKIVNNVITGYRPFKGGKLSSILVARKSNNILIMGNEIECYGNAGIEVEGNASSAVECPSDIQVTGNKIRGKRKARTGINILNSSKVAVKLNQISDCHYGIRLANSTSGVVWTSDNFIEKNTVVNSTIKDIVAGKQRMSRTIIRQ